MEVLSASTYEGWGLYDFKAFYCRLYDMDILDVIIKLL